MKRITFILTLLTLVTTSCEKCTHCFEVDTFTYVVGGTVEVSTSDTVWSHNSCDINPDDFHSFYTIEEKNTVQIYSTDVYCN